MRDLIAVQKPSTRQKPPTRRPVGQRRGRTPRRTAALRIVAAAALAVGALIVVQLVRQSNTESAGVTVSVRAPASDATVSNPVRFAFTVQGGRLGTPEQGLDHLHVSLDGGQAVGVYQNSFTSSLPPGRHTLVVELADAAHDSLGATARTTFTVTDISP